MSLPRAASAMATATVLATLLATGTAPPVAAAGTLTLTTLFPAIAVQPGSTAAFTLTIGASAATTAELTVSGVPDGWTAGLHGSGLEVQSVYVAAGGTATLQLDVSIPPDAADGRSTIVVNARDGSSNANLPLTISVAQAAGGTVELTTDFPTLRGASTATFPFTLQLRNNTPQQLTFSLQAAGPTGWTVTAQPTGQEQAASFTVDAGSTRSITVSASAPDSVEAGSYPIDVQAIGSAGRTAEAQLSVEISGSVKMSLSTSDGRLNASATAGSVGDLGVAVSNDGTSPLTGLNLTSSAPSDWQVTFDSDTIDAIPAGQTATVTAHIQPSGDAIAGDYVVTIRAGNDQASKSMDIRVTVDTSPLWGAVGIILVLAAVGGLYLVFQRYGRR